MKISIPVLLLLFIVSLLFSQEVADITPTSSSIGENLDLQAVATLFADAKDLEEFEKKLNASDNEISNLDLNEDGEVDYLRVVEQVEGTTHLVTIQAALGKDQFQDVATIEADLATKGEENLQIVGDTALYGEGHIVEPEYTEPPQVYVVWYSSFYSPWRSPWYWHYYPPYYRPWPRVTVSIYRTRVYRHRRYHCHYSSVRRHSNASRMHTQSRRNDYGATRVSHTNSSVKASAKNTVKAAPANNKSTPPASTAGRAPSTGKPVQSDWQKPSSLPAPQTVPSTGAATLGGGNALQGPQGPQPATTMQPQQNRPGPTVPPAASTQPTTTRSNTVQPGPKQGSPQRNTKPRGGGGGKRR